MTVMNAASTGNIYKTIDQLIDVCRHRKKDCHGCPIAIECSKIRNGTRPGDLLKLGGIENA